MSDANPARRCAYQDQDSPLTLREGLAEYYEKNPAVTPPSEASDEGEVFFASHDVTHVVFGTTTSLLDETVNDLWSMYGLDIRAREYIKSGLAVPEVKAIFKDFSVWAMVKEFSQLPRLWPLIRRRAKAMTKPWPWRDYAQYLDVSLAELRREFGIQVIEG